MKERIETGQRFSENITFQQSKDAQLTVTVCNNSIISCYVFH